MNSTLSLDAIEHIARQRAAKKIGWYTHASVYLSVNAMLGLLALAGHSHGSLFPTLGWGLGLLLHGAIVLITMPGAGLHEWLVRKERARLATQQDPW
jgi:hypothetical protein